MLVQREDPSLQIISAVLEWGHLNNRILYQLVTHNPLR